MAKHLAYLCIFWGFFSLQTAAQLRIAGGTSIHPGDVPYHLQIRYLGKYQCGAALTVVNGLHVVVTAGSCVTQGALGTALLPKEDLIVVGGRIHINGRHYYEQYRCVSKIVRHIDWRRTPVLLNDVAILLLDENFRINRLVQPLELTPLRNTNPTGSVTITGWGNTGPTAEVLSGPLQIASLPVVATEDCNSAYSFTSTGANIPSSAFCVGSPKNPMQQGACEGDEGSPAVSTVNDTYLVGVFSFGTGTCGNRHQPSVYTDLSFYVPWIQKIAKHATARLVNDIAQTSLRSALSARTVQGEFAVPHDAPYNVKIINQQQSVCSGALVRDPVHRQQMVLTAASCVRERTPDGSLSLAPRPNRFKVIAGKLDKPQVASTAQVRKIRRLELHPSWLSAMAKSEDYAILILERSFTENEHVEPLDLSEGANRLPGIFGRGETGADPIPWIKKVAVSLNGKRRCKG